MGVHEMRGFLDVFGGGCLVGNLRTCSFTAHLSTTRIKPRYFTPSLDRSECRFETERIDGSRILLFLFLGI